MTIATLCDMIELQPQIKDRVIAFAENFDFTAVDQLQRGYLIYHNMNDALNQTRVILGDDPGGIRILACMLRAALHTYEIYREKGIPEEIFIDTMKCFPRFIAETYQMTGAWCFDRYWWTTRQAGCHLFRIGALEYEIKHLEKDLVISIHIPSDASFSPLDVDTSLEEAKCFFARHYPALADGVYRCHSWLLDPQLRKMLDSNSNIIQFQNRFDIMDGGEAGNDFSQWVFHTGSMDYETYPENTSLQKNMKKHLLAGGVIRNAYGRMKQK